MPLVLRTVKGSQLTTAEMDGNLTYLESLNAALPPVNITATGTVTLDRATHANRLLICTGATSVNLTLTTDAAGGWTNDDSINAMQMGNGSVSILIGTASNLYAPTGVLATTAAQYRLVGAIKVNNVANSWALTEISGAASSAITVIDMPAGSTCGVSQTNFTLGTVSIPGNTFTTGKMLRFEYFANFQTSADASYEILYGGQVVGAAGGSGLNSYGTTGLLNGVCSVYAISNSSQRGSEISSNNASSYSSLNVRSATVDATVAQNFVIRCTTGTGSTAVTLIGGKVSIY